METERVIRVPTTWVSDFESLITDETKKYVDKTYELFMEQLAKLVKLLCAQAEVPYVGDGAVSGQFPIPP